MSLFLVIIHVLGISHSYLSVWSCDIHILTRLENFEKAEVRLFPQMKTDLKKSFCCARLYNLVSLLWTEWWHRIFCTVFIDILEEKGFCSMCALSSHVSLERPVSPSEWWTFALPERIRCPLNSKAMQGVQHHKMKPYVIFTYTSTYLM